MAKLESKTLLNLYHHVLKARRLEERLVELFTEKAFPGFIHSALGQEAVGVGVALNLRPEDYITYTHRGRPILIGKGADLKPFLAETFGRRDGSCKGRAGEMHYANLEMGILNFSLVIGGSIPFATGVAFSCKYSGKDRVTVAFFGDGAVDTGSFHEAMNVASLWKLPMLFACENNGWAQFTPQSQTASVPDVYKKAAAYNIPGESVDGDDAVAVYESSQKAISKIRKGKGPLLLEFKTHRWLGHYVGDPQKYRDQKELAEVRGFDPLKRLEERLLKEGVLTKKMIEEADSNIKVELEEALTFAKGSPWPNPEEAVEGVYC